MILIKVLLLGVYILKENIILICLIDISVYPYYIHVLFHYAYSIRRIIILVS